MVSLFNLSLVSGMFEAKVTFFLFFLVGEYLFYIESPLFQACLI